MKQLKSPFLDQSSVDSSLKNFILKNPPIYTHEDTFVWKKMIDNVTKSFKEYSEFIYPPFKQGYHSLALENNSIPNIKTINQKLSPVGWSVVYANGFVPAKIYALMLANQIFPISIYLRPLKYFDYSAAPDFAHDVIGHLPMLFVKEFRDLLKKWAIKASQCESFFLDEETYRLTAALIKEKEEKIPCQNKIYTLTQSLENVYNQLNTNPSSLSILAKFYGWSFEFGVIKGEGDKVPNIFGAAIVSSAKETQNICKGRASLSKFNEDTVKTGVNYTSLQERVFYAENFESYNYYLNNILIEKNE